MLPWNCRLEHPLLSCDLRKRIRGTNKRQREEEEESKEEETVPPLGKETNGDKEVVVRSRDRTGKRDTSLAKRQQVHQEELPRFVVPCPSNCPTITNTIPTFPTQYPTQYPPLRICRVRRGGTTICRCLDVPLNQCGKGGRNQPPSRCNRSPPCWNDGT